MSKETFAQTSLLCVSYPVRSCVSLTCLRLEDMKTGILLCHMLGLCYVLMPAPAKYPERSWRLPLLGEDRHGVEQRKGDPQGCPDKKKRLGKMGWCLSLSLWLAYLIQRNVLGSIQVIANKWLDFLLKAE